MTDTFSVRLEDPVYGRVLLDEVVSDTAANAESAAQASPGVSGPTGSFVAKQVVSQAEVLAVTGTDADGDPVYSDPNVALPAPVLPPAVPDPHGRW